MNLPATSPSRRLLWLAAVFALLAGSTGVWAQSAPEQASAQALELFNQNRIQDAANAYEQLLKDYPTSSVVPEAQFRFGYLSFLLGNYDRATEVLNKILGPPAPAEIQELAYGLLPQVAAAKASKLEPKDYKRTGAYQDAISKYDLFLKKFPKSDQVESAQYGRALALFQIGKYDDAARGLRSNLANFANSESILDSQYLLALTLATEANLALENTPEAASSQAMSQYDEALRLLEGIVQKKSDVALANDAQFETGEILANKARFSAKAESGGLYSQAIDAYRAVQPREGMVKAQSDRLAAIVARIRTAAAARNLGQVKQLQRLQEREQQKSAQLQSKPDLTVAARIQVGTIYFTQGRYDAARVLLRQMQQFASSDDQKKQILYYITLTYASQNLAEKAVENYDAFRERYKNDPMGENLPVVMSAMFLSADPKLNDPAKGLQYAKTAASDYPGGRMKNEALMQQATALAQLRRFDEALAAYQSVLAANPKKEVAATAAFGIATIYQSTGKIDQALSAYKDVAAKYPGTPDAEKADFALGQLTLQKGDAAGAITALTAFPGKHPGSQYLGPALFVLAQAQLASGNKEAALATFKEVGEKYPKGEVGPLSYFQEASIYASEQKSAEMLKILQDFISKYPESDKVFYAYDMIGQTQVSTGAMTDAISTYTGMAAKHPTNPQAATALEKAADLWEKYAEAQGRYAALPDATRKEWKHRVDESIQTAEGLISTYPESAQVSPALETIAACQRLLVGAKLETPAEADNYFEELGKKNESAPGAKSKIAFAHAAFVYERDKSKALAEMTSAYDPKLVYAPAEMDLYGSALLNQGQVKEAREIYEKLAADYPNPAGVNPAQAPPDIAQAQAAALYGLGKCDQKSGDFAAAGKRFDLLQKLYPWSPKVTEASFGIAQAAYQQKDYTKAAALLIPIARAQTATTELRADAMLLGGKIQEEQGNLEAAIDYYIKIATFFQSVPDAAAEGLWRGGQLLEKQVGTLTDPTKKQQQLGKAIQAYKDLAEKYPDSQYTAQAKERLQALQPGK